MSSGFGAIYHNYHHAEDKYSNCELFIKENVLEALGLKQGIDFFHERVFGKPVKVEVREEKTITVRVNGKEISRKVFYMKTRVYWPDFYIPSGNIDIEVDPLFHSSFKPYLYRCINRTKRLKKQYGMITYRIQLATNSKGMPKMSDKVRLRIMKEIKELMAERSQAPDYKGQMSIELFTK